MEKKYSAAQLTRMQELGSAWIFRRALKDKIRYKKWEDILNDPKYDELGGKNGIYPNVDKDWLETFYLQQKKMLEEFSNSKFTEFNREYGFMKYISNLVKVKYGISRKDNWDPADIWCVKDQDKVIADIEKVIGKKESSSIDELNTLLRTLFEKRIVVGVSLKKISGKQAKYEEINVGKGLQFITKKNAFKLSKMKIDFSSKPGKTFQLKTTDTAIFLETIEDNKKVTYKFQIRGVSSSKFSNLKWEPTSTAASAARLGKAPVNLVMDILKDFKVVYHNNHNLYPKSAAEFKQKQTEYVKMFNIVKRKADTGIADEKQFVATMTKTFLTSKLVATSKLMQLSFLYELNKKPKDVVETIMTKITFAAQKKGKQFGPFGKLY
jgi:hypothetical protein